MEKEARTCDSRMSLISLSRTFGNGRDIKGKHKLNFHEVSHFTSCLAKR